MVDFKDTSELDGQTDTRTGVTIMEWTPLGTTKI